MLGVIKYFVLKDDRVNNYVFRLLVGVFNDETEAITKKLDNKNIIYEKELLYKKLMLGFVFSFWLICYKGSFYAMGRELNKVLDYLCNLLKEDLAKKNIQEIDIDFLEVKTKVINLYMNYQENRGTNLNRVAENICKDIPNLFKCDMGDDVEKKIINMFTNYLIKSITQIQDILVSFQ